MPTTSLMTHSTGCVWLLPVQCRCYAYGFFNSGEMFADVITSWASPLTVDLMHVHAIFANNLGDKLTNYVGIDHNYGWIYIYI